MVFTTATKITSVTNDNLETTEFLKKFSSHLCLLVICLFMNGTCFRPYWTLTNTIQSLAAIDSGQIDIVSQCCQHLVDSVPCHTIIIKWIEELDIIG